MIERQAKKKYYDIILTHLAHSTSLFSWVYEMTTDDKRNKQKQRWASFRPTIQ